MRAEIHEMKSKLCLIRRAWYVCEINSPFSLNRMVLWSQCNHLSQMAEEAGLDRAHSSSGLFPPFCLKWFTTFQSLVCSPYILIISVFFFNPRWNSSFLCVWITCKLFLNVFIITSTVNVNRSWNDIKCSAKSLLTRQRLDLQGSGVVCHLRCQTKELQDQCLYLLPSEDLGGKNITIWTTSVRETQLSLNSLYNRGFNGLNYSDNCSALVCV